MNALMKLKEMMTSIPVLLFYDLLLPVRLRTNASSEGLGAMIEQQKGTVWYPVAYASRSFTQAEKNYSPI